MSGRVSRERSDSGSIETTFRYIPKQVRNTQCDTSRYNFVRILTKSLDVTPHCPFECFGRIATETYREPTNILIQLTS